MSIGGTEVEEARRRPRRRGRAPIRKAIDLVLILADLRYGLTIEEMASRLRISERMVYKLLASLEAAGVRLKRTRELRRGGGWARLIRLVDIRGRRLVHLVGSGA